jgi:CRP-like cAMP-binding protein
MQLSALPVEQRVALTLLKLGEKLGRENDSGLLIDVPLSRDELAEMTGTTPETVSRILSQLQNQKIIDSGRQWVTILNRPGLERLAAKVLP